ncbi:MAG TPA: hypothetical protein VGB95_03335 [Chitinophagales bacterium]
MTANDTNIEIAKLQNEIAAEIGIDARNVIFNFKEKGGIVRLDVVTVNPKHEQSFLFHTINGTDKIDALKKMLEYVNDLYPHENSMTIQWIKIGENKLHTSYFRAKNMYEALDKFFYERDIAQYKIFSVVLNPIA